MSLGFYVDLQRCIGCRTCQVACKDRHDLQKAGARPRRVESFEVGSYPDAQVFHTSLGCNHCENPACVAACPTRAMHKAEDGTVQHDDSLCIVCRNCMLACPYQAPQYDEDNARIVKCDSCKALREAGMNPVCVDACPMRALEFGDIDELRAAHGSDAVVSEFAAIGTAGITNPNLIVKVPEAAKQDDPVSVVL